MNTKIILSSIVHKRYDKIQHFFKYKVPSLFIDLDELEVISSKSKIFSVNSFNIFSFYEKDHGYRDGRSISEFIQEKLKSYDVNYNKLKIKIICFPRIFGYVFNPLSIIYCYDENELISIFYEVKNTSNEQHTYIFSKGQNNNLITLKHECEKNFYVSPFINMKAKYKFMNKIPDKNMSISIDLYDESNKRILLASQYGKRFKLDSYNLLKNLLLNPFLIFKVIFAILFEAMRIMSKGGKYYPREKKIADTISFEGKL